MRKSDVFPYYRKCVEEMGKRYSDMKSMFTEGYADELCTLRGYVGDEQKALVREMKLGYCEVEDVDVLGPMREELGLVSSKGNFLLGGRFIIPVHDMEGGILALIGYYPDVKKYITTPSPFFSKDCLLFNMGQAYRLSWSEYGGVVFLVEGIFDCLSLRSIGLPCVATMGSSVSEIKRELLKSFRKVVGIPDNDATGRKALDVNSRSGWKMPYGSVMVRFEGGTLNMGGNILKVKDMDNFVSWYDAGDVREVLLSFAECSEGIEVLKL